ncbi:MAG TPA: helix-turn-helix transcriptional regulator [Candidatus Limnocylindrales bacterium]|nr:helix-turn-helix transcriptional regulator [Candidatus Limnocylindrales bacterium]
MASRAGPAQQGLDDARELARTLARELREARKASGLSQTSVARAAGMSPSQLSRLERGAIDRPDIVQICCAGRVLGLRTSVKLYPVGSPMRDAGQLRLFERFLGICGPTIRVRREVGLPIPGDLRAWDALLADGRARCVADLETHVTDAQALERRMRLKQRDDPRAGVMLLVLSRTAHHRSLLATHREAFRELLPLDSPAIVRALRAGRCPPGSGIVVV